VRIAGWTGRWSDMFGRLCVGRVVILGLVEVMKVSEDGRCVGHIDKVVRPGGIIELVTCLLWWLI
jgi:hypothetical protein